MKKYILSILTSFVSIIALAQSLEHPYSVSQAIAKKDGSSTYYHVKGYIVGELSDYSNNKYFYQIAPPFQGTTCYLLADTKDEINLSKCLPVQVTSTGIDSLNLEENPVRWKKEVIVCGFLRDYFAMPGLKNTTLYLFPPQEWVDHSKEWMFYENMEGDYTPKSQQSIFAGGSYLGETGRWIFDGATYGNTSNDNKWESAAARIRLSGASSSEEGYIRMEQDKENGIGEVRFWAGYYDKDSGGSLSIYLSGDQGKSWERVINSASIAKGWKEYQFFIRRSGNLRLKIQKGETGSAGINVDNIHISDYTTAQSIEKELSSTTLSCYGTKGFLILRSDIPQQSYSIYHIGGTLIRKGVIALQQETVPLPGGIYIVSSKDEVKKVIVP